MSQRRSLASGDWTPIGAGQRPAPIRVVGVAGVVMLLSIPLSVLWDVTTVTGEPALFAGVVLASGLVGVLLARLLSPLAITGVSLSLLGVCWAGYQLTVPFDATLPVLVGGAIADTLALVTGLSVLQIVNVEVWALAAAPAPVLLTAYLASRRRWVGAVSVAGLVLLLFVLTGDLPAGRALLGVLGGLVAVGSGEVERRGGGLGAAEPLVVVLAVVVVGSATLSVVPALAGTVGPGDAGSGGLGGLAESGSVEASLVDSSSSLRVGGSVTLSPAVRFTVTSDRADYWRVGSFDRYTGDGWVRTGTSAAYTGRLSAPPGRSARVTQRYRAEVPLGIMPAAWRPTTVQAGVPVRVTSEAGLAPGRLLDSGAEYTVSSRVPLGSPSRLREAGTDYPAGLQARYTQLPATQPDRVAARTARLTAAAATPYDTARVLERWLQNNRAYSLEVERPSGQIADGFLFEMEAGYCSYYATTMVAMLRTEEIPARLVVGYTPGQRVAEDRWVARGLNSHAWVEAYFPGVGWVRFDPTPAAPRTTAERSRLETARANEDSRADTDATREEPLVTTATPTPVADEDSGDETGEQLANETPTGQLERPAGASDTGLGGLRGLLGWVDPASVALSAVVVGGVISLVRRAGLVATVSRVLWVRSQPRRDPEQDLRRAYARLEYLLERDGQGRATGETVRTIARETDDDRIERIARLYERAHYGGDVDAAAAEEAVALVDELVAERGWLPSR